MNPSLLLWVGSAGALVALVLLAVLALRRSRRAAENRRAAAAAALQQAQLEASRRAAERAAAQQAAAEAETRLRTELAAQRQAEQQQAAERAAEAAALAAVQAAYREGERRAAEEAARQAATTSSPAPPAAPPPTMPAPTTRLVMVADDSKVVRVKTSRLLAQHGYRVVLAEDGVHAAQLLEEEVPLVLITDVEMPQMDGLELTRYVRQHPLASHIPIIMITSADDRLQAAAAEAGVTLVLGKPYAEDRLLACITQAAAGQALGR